MEKLKFLTFLPGRVILGQGRLAGITPPPTFKIGIHGSERKGNLLVYSAKGNSVTTVH